MQNPAIVQTSLRIKHQHAKRNDDDFQIFKKNE